jgi:hypothetical protein
MSITNTIQYAFDGSSGNTSTVAYKFFSYASSDIYTDDTTKSRTGFGVSDNVPIDNNIDGAWYIGSEPNVPFHQLLVAMGTVGVSGISGNVVWEYPTSGATWNALTFGDASTAQLLNSTGYATLDWDIPLDWVDSVVNGVSARWIRCRILGSYTTPPSMRFISIGRTINWTKTIDIPYTSLSWMSTFLDWSVFLNNRYGAVRFRSVYARLGGVGEWTRLTSPLTGYAGSDNQQSIKNIVDLYPLFKLNWTPGSSQLLEIRFGVTTNPSNNSADFISEVAGRINLTYQYDETENDDTLLKTIRIPLRTIPAGLTTVDQLIDEIPALNDFLPEGNKTIKDMWIEVEGNNCNSSSDTSTFGLRVHVDALASTLLMNCVNTSSSSSYHWAIHSLNSLGLDTSIPHSWYMRATQANNLFNNANSILYVTYSYSKSNTTRSLQSLVIPLGYSSTPLRVSDSSNSNGLQFNLQRPLWVQEPGNITLKKSAIKFISEELSYGSEAQSIRIKATGDVAFTAYPTGPRVNPSGQISIMHPLTNLQLTRGKNFIGLSEYSNYREYICRGRSHVLYLNYESDVHENGEWVHNKTILKLLMNMDYVEASWGTYGPFCPIGTTEQSDYFLNDASIQVCETGNITQPFTLTATIFNDTSQHNSLQWALEHSGPIKFLTSEYSSVFYVPVLEWFSQVSEGLKPISPCTGKIKPYIGNGFGIIATQNSIKSLVGMTTYHSCSTSISGQMYRMPGIPNEVILLTSDIQDMGCQLKSATIDNVGNYTISWPDDSADISIITHYSGSAYGITQRNKSTS